MKVTLVLLAVLARHAVAQDTNASMLTMLGFPACSVCPLGTAEFHFPAGD
jgi:hypothetical protein